VQFWGANFFGELGDGNAIVQSAPIAPVGLDAGVSSVTVGSHHSCVLTTGGAVVCWGRGSYGELGNGPTADINLTPSLVPGLTGVTAVAAGDESTCAVAGGTVVCWGYGGDGSLGQGTLGNASVPGPVR
jgi:alpha-tubulin suppressor-like RCC1 family protein